MSTSLPPGLLRSLRPSTAPTTTHTPHTLAPLTAPPPGSGKTSLLNALAGRIPVTKGATLTGDVYVDGVAMSATGDMSTRSAYIMQDDALFALSTVQETLMFAARLRLPAAMSLADKEKRVTQVIEELGLVKARNTIIGNQKVRGLSGGERKRVNIGVDMLHDPKLLFVDEPTSGLDSFQAQSVSTRVHPYSGTAYRTLGLSQHTHTHRVHRIALSGSHSTLTHITRTS